MIASDEQRFLGELTLLVGFYGVKLSEADIERWWRVMHQYDFNEFCKAADRHVKDPDQGSFCPKPADIVRLITGTGKGASSQAWAEVSDAVRRHGPWVSVTFDDPLINRAIVEVGGWVWLCEQTDSEWPFIGNKFEQIYRQLRTTESYEHPSHLVGLTESTNRALNARFDPPLMLGNHHKALDVYQTGSENFLQVTSSIEIEDKHAISVAPKVNAPRQISSQGLTIESIM